MEKITQIRQYADCLRLPLLRKEAESYIHQAQLDQPGYLSFMHNVLQQEVHKRQKNELEKRLRLAKLGRNYNLDLYDTSSNNGLPKRQLSQLRELIWVDQAFNVILMGPSGTGKTFIASGLVHDAVLKGYRAYFTTMEDLVHILKMKEITSTALNSYNRYLKAHLLAIDDVMLLPIKKPDAVSLFNLINHLHEQCSIIITTNKSPKQWAETLEDEVLATALLDRLLYKCEVVKLEGESYRMANRKNILVEQSPDQDKENKL